MSIWSFDLGIDASWPEWFQEHRLQADAELRDRADACMRGTITEAEFKTWALESSRLHVAWIDALPPDRRAWIEKQERGDEFTAVVRPDPDRRSASSAGSGDNR